MSIQRYWVWKDSLHNADGDRLDLAHVMEEVVSYSDHVAERQDAELDGYHRAVGDIVRARERKYATSLYETGRLVGHREANEALYHKGVADERARIREAVEKLHTRAHYGQTYGLKGEQFDIYYCRECADMCHSRSGLMCDDPVDAPWPCAELTRILSIIDPP